MLYRHFSQLTLWIILFDDLDIKKNFKLGTLVSAMRCAYRLVGSSSPLEREDGVCSSETLHTAHKYALIVYVTVCSAYITS